MILEHKGNNKDLWENVRNVLKDKEFSKSRSKFMASMNDLNKNKLSYGSAEKVFENHIKIIAKMINDRIVDRNLDCIVEFVSGGIESQIPKEHILNYKIAKAAMHTIVNYTIKLTYSKYKRCSIGKMIRKNVRIGEIDG